MSHLKIDLGCGSCKKDGTVGIDINDQPGVDYILNLDEEPLPFPDESVDYVYSSHCLEHLKNPVRVFSEITRVCIDGAKLEFWTPYAWENSAFIYDHKTFFNEDHYLHIGFWFVEFWEKILNAKWLLKEFTYIIDSDTLIELYEHKIPLKFALKYYKGIVKEFCVHLEIKRGYQGEIIEPERTFAVSRFSEKHKIKSNVKKKFLEKFKKPIKQVELKKAINWLSSK